MVAKVLIRKRDEVIVGDTNYYIADYTFKYLGATLSRVPVDNQGISVEAIETICKKRKIRAVYVTSHHHHPTTVTLTPERRIRLLALAAQYKFAIIEDDYDYDFHYNNSPVLPLASADRDGLVIYIGSFSKTTAPAFRVGYIIAPEEMIDELGKLRRLLDRQGDSVLELAFAELLDKGVIQRYLKKALKKYHQRRDLCCQLLQEELGDAVEFDIPAGGMAIWARFNKRINLPALSKRALEHKLLLSDGTQHNPLDENLNACRMGFASRNLTEIKESVALLKKIV